MKLTILCYAAALTLWVLMKDKSLGMFWFGFLATILGFVVYWLWRRQHERPLQAPGVVTIGEPPVDNLAAPLSRTDAASALVRNVAEVVASSVDSVSPRIQATPAQTDDLQLIKGIGKVYAGRLNAAGIATFAELAAADPQKLAAIVQLKAWQAAAPEDWIEQARRLQ